MLNQHKNSVSDPHPNLKKIQCDRSEEFDNALLQWFHETRSSNTPISGVTFKGNATILDEKLELKNFQASSGCLN